MLASQTMAYIMDCSTVFQSLTRQRLALFFTQDNQEISLYCSLLDTLKKLVPLG